MNPRRKYYQPSQRGVFRTSTRMQALLDGSAAPLGILEIEGRLNLSRNAVNTAMQRLLADGGVERVGLATYRSTKLAAPLPPVIAAVKAVESFIRPISKERMMAGR